MNYLIDYIIIKNSGLFDSNYYLKAYPDVRQADIDPLMHFVKHGWREGRNPNSEFHTSLYLQMYEDVRDAGVNPFVHYIRHGKNEHRTFKNDPISTSMQTTFIITQPHLDLAHAKDELYKSDKFLLNYKEELKKAIEKSEDFVEYKDHAVDEASKTKLIAFYLPQFHPFPENDAWWGKGFTEWTNVSKAIPQYVGQYQPHLPGELGFYDLRVPEVQERQVELAKNYGIYGFCFHYYWFAGKRLLERPLDQFIQNKKIDFPFCLCWANENWTRRWDGQENDILIGQNHTPETDIEFIKDLEPYFLHSNYIRQDNKLVLIVYRPELLPDPKKTIQRWREFAIQKGWGELYLICAQTFGMFSDPRKIGFDAAIEFPPHNNPSFPYNDITQNSELLNSNYAGKIYDFRNLILSSFFNAKSTDFPLIRTVSPGWDNEPRKPGKGHSYANSSPSVYKTWLLEACQYSLGKKNSKESFVFINAWNEWGEGAYLEPDRKYGYANLEATYEAINEINKYSDRLTEEKLIYSERKHDTAVVLHLYYPDLWEEIFSKLKSLNHDFDLFITIPIGVNFDEGKILKCHKDTTIIRIHNRGRDIAGFLKILPVLIKKNYSYALKIHTKKTLHREDGENWRNQILLDLLGSEHSIKTIKELLSLKKTGLVSPEGHVIPSIYYWGIDNEYIQNLTNTRALAKKSGIEFTEFPFIAGSMFWFKPTALKKIADLGISLLDFEPELGQKDGTLAHALERFIGLIIQSENNDIYEINQNEEWKKVGLEQVKNKSDYSFATATFNGKIYSP
jgi:lipopolysaccharide biosynthesis protein